jgi:tRNA(fMet)-specific endonuclease VapC
VGIVLDTDVVIQGERNDFNLQRWVTSRPDEQFEIAAITVAELWHGVERATPAFRGEREAYLGGIFNFVRILPYTETTALEHARIWAALESSGKMIGYYDLIVAATALEHGSTVATFNRRHFESVRGLKVIVPE